MKIKEKQYEDEKSNLCKEISRLKKFSEEKEVEKQKLLNSLKVEGENKVIC